MGVYAGAEQALVDEWVEAVLTTPEVGVLLDGIAPGLSERVYLEVGPPDIPTPFIVFQCLSPPRDIRGVGVSRVMVDTIYVVKAVGSVSTYGPLVPIAAVIDQAMTSAVGGGVSDGLVFTSVRNEQYSLVTREQGEIFRHLGGEYRIQAQG